MDKLKIMLGWHKDWIMNWQEQLKLDDYTMLWISFGEGVVMTLVLLWLI